jgi:hypothetical protein
MNNLIFPEIFSDSVKAFFTRKPLGINVDEICRILAIEKCNVYLPVQKHTDNVQVIGSDLETKVADSVLTGRKGILIGIQVADCVPVICYDEKKMLIGAVHAGWRGTASQIVKKTLSCMIENFGSFPEDIKIAFGPSIRWRCYHVERDVQEAIYEATGEGNYYLQESGKYCVDLASANRYQALSLGIPEENIWISHDCTYCNPEDYHSYRYEKAYNGAQGGFIGIF